MALPPRPFVEGPSAWIGAELARRPQEWVYPLSGTEIAEIEANVERLRGRDLAGVDAGDFVLPMLGPALDRLCAEVLDGRGFVLIRGLPIAGRPIGDVALAYWAVGTRFGHPRSQNAAGHLLGHVCDLGLSTDDPNVRTYQTAQRQNFHTDSCDIVGLLCRRTAKSGGLSSIVSSMTIYNEMARRRPDLAARLFRPIATDRRGEVPPGEKGYFEIPVFNDHAGHLSAIYDRNYITSAQRFADAPRLTADDIAALDLLDELANDPELRLDMEFHPGDMQFVHNHTTLHDRTAFVDWPEPERKRHLLRLWLAAPGARPLPQVFVQRYGSVTVGDRGGIVCERTRLHAPLEPVSG